MAVKIEKLREEPGFSSSSNPQNTDYECLKTLLKREPSPVEWAMTQALWSEHCSYKTSKRHLNRLPAKAPWVICGPGENAGVIDIGDGLACVLKMESHNHPSSINPYQGAATGVGGILRDIFAMGAQPVGILDALFLGSPAHPKTSSSLKGIVSGVSAYGNCFGVPIVGGSTHFHSSYTHNPLVNVMAIGLVQKEHLLTSCASGEGNLILYIGAKTTYAGLHGATQSSRTFVDEQDSTRQNKDVHVADPLLGQCVFRALHALQKADIIVAAQDMGAAGLTCASVEMAARGNMGFILNLNQIPLEDPHMNAESILLAETQERMLLIVEANAQKEAYRILNHWEIPYACIGHLTSTGYGVIHHNGESVAHIPLQALSNATPIYDRPSRPLKSEKIKPHQNFPAPCDNREALKHLVNTANGGSKRWIYEQYDRTIQGNAIETAPENTALIRLPHSLKGLALSASVTPRYCAADPFVGAKQAVAESYRNITAIGATPKAITDCLNFGSPENEEVMAQLIASVDGLREASLALDLPIISGNVSLYNQTAYHSILPTPTVGCVGLLEDVTKRATSGFKNSGDIVFLVGHTQGWLGQSIYARDILGREDGAPPPVDLATEKQNGDFVRSLIAQGRLNAAHDCSDGGLLVALAKMALTNFNTRAVRGMSLQPEFWSLDALSLPSHAFLFGEDQGRYIITTPPHFVHSIEAEAHTSEVPILRLGVTGGENIIIPHEDLLPLEELRALYEIPLLERLASDPGS